MYPVVLLILQLLLPMKLMILLKIFNVKLESFEASIKIKVIKEVRAATGLGFKDSKKWLNQHQLLLLKIYQKLKLKN